MKNTHQAKMQTSAAIMAKALSPPLSDAAAGTARETGSWARCNSRSRHSPTGHRGSPLEPQGPETAPAIGAAGAGVARPRPPEMGILIVGRRRSA